MGAPAESSRTAREERTFLSNLNRRMPWGILALWAVLYLPRPFHLGFYADDWWSLIESPLGTAPFSLDRLKCFFAPNAPYAGRPLDAALMFVVTSVGGTSPFLYQVIAAVFVLAAAISLRAWLVSLLPDRVFRMRYVAADLATMVWLSIPWSVAATAWPVLAPAAMSCQILFTEACRRILPPHKLNWKTFASAGLLIVASYLTYEPFYFQFFVVGAFYVLFAGKAYRTRSSLAGIATLALASQLCAVLYNRLHAGTSSAKSLASNWYAIFSQSLNNLLAQLRYAVGDFYKLYELWLLLYLVLAAVTVWQSWRAERILPPFHRLLGLLLMGAAAVPPALLTFALAGYGASTAGITARSYQGVSWAVAIVFLCLCSVVLSSRPSPVTPIVLVAVLAIVVLNCVAQQRVLKEWAFVWNEEKQVLSRAPAHIIEALPLDARILYIGPAYCRGMVIFGADWDISGAVNSLPPLARDRRHNERMHTIHSAGEYNWTWDGKELTQVEPGYWTLKYPASSLFLWDFAHNQIVQASAGYRLDREQSRPFVQLAPAN
jgi:hypothetical protein